MIAMRRSSVVVALFAFGALGAACATTDPISSGGGGQSPTTSIGEGGGGGETVTDGPGASVGGGGPCGDGVCQEFEACDTCFEDCGECPVPSCGDGTCDPVNEDCQGCPEDCGTCSVCGDGTCQADEDCKLCYEDCGICACAPDGLEPNGGSPTAKTAVSGTDYCDLSVCAGDFDWFKFTIVDGFTAKITFKEGQGDLDMEIYDPLYVNGSYSADDDEAVTLSGLDPGTYYARVYGKSNATNPDYCFRVDTN